MRAPLSAFAAAAAVAFVVGCDTMRRAREAQEEIAPAAVEPQEVSEADEAEGVNASTNAVVVPPPRVKLVGSSLGDFVAFALTNRPDVAEAALAVESARLAVKGIEADEWPQLGLSGGYSQSTHNSTPHFSWRQDGNSSASISFDLLLYDFGRLDAQEAEAREKAVAAELDFAETRLAAFNEVADAYFNLLRNDALLAVALTNEMQYAEHLSQAETLFSAGEAKKLDVLKARLDLSDAHLAAITASNDVVTAGAELVRALGLDSGRADRVDLVRPAADAFTQPRRVLAATDFDAVKALADARVSSPLLMTMRARLRAASARVDYAVADLMPSLSLTSAFSFADPTWNWSWGVGAVQSIFQGFRKTTAVDTAVVAMRSSRTALEREEQSLGCQLAVAVSVRDTARQSLKSARVQVEQAKENYENVVEQYKVGEASRIDFTDAASSYAAALGARVKAFYAGEIAEAALVKLTGLPAVYEN